LLYKETALLLSDWNQFTLSDFLEPLSPSKLRGFSFNPKDKIVEFCELLMPRRTEIVKKVLKVTLIDGSTIYCAENLRFLKEEDHTYVEARHLVVGTKLLGVKSLPRTREYIVAQVEMRDREMRPAMVSSIRFNNFALGCGVFVHS